jgi:nicotinamide mononucleotide (NMN) deamidase PncC
MTSAKTGATFGMIAGISGTTGTIGATTADSYGMVWVGTEARDGKPTQ